MKHATSFQYLLASFILMGCLTGCDDRYRYNPEWKRPHNEFNFSTERPHLLRLEYSHMQMKNIVFFRVYDQNPLKNDHNGAVLDKTLEPIFVGATNIKGIFDEKISIPSFVNKIYIYTDNRFAQQLIVAPVGDGDIYASDNSNEDYAKAVSVDDITRDTIVSLSENIGAYCFEDTWPNEGDYDFNDVVVKGTQTTHWALSRTSVKTDQGFSAMLFSGSMKVYQVEATFKAFVGKDGYQDGLCCYVDLPGGMVVDKESYYIRKPGETEWSEYEPANRLHTEELYHKHGGFKYNGHGTGLAHVIWFTTSIANDGSGCEYRVVLNYAYSRTSIQKTNFRPFISVREGFIPYSYDVPYYEVHLPYETPTQVMPLKYWSTAYDASLPASITSKGEGCFYLRAYEKGHAPYDANYPFAMKLCGATEQDIAPLLSTSNEGVPISVICKGYPQWVESDGIACTDWYKGE